MGRTKQNAKGTNVGDTISRQAAIDVFEDTTFTKNEIRRRLSELPPAQPEIIRCGKCAHKDKKIDYCHYLGITICECDYCSYAVRRADELGNS